MESGAPLGDPTVGEKDQGNSQPLPKPKSCFSKESVECGFCVGNIHREGGGWGLGWVSAGKVGPASLIPGQERETLSLARKDRVTR